MDLPSPIMDLTGLLAINESFDYYTVNHIKHDVVTRGTAQNYDTFIFDRLLSLEELDEKATEYLESELSKKLLTKEEVFFMPADHMEYINTYGKPLYIFMKRKADKFVYEFETHFRPLLRNVEGLKKNSEL